MKDIELSQRMQTVADMVEKCGTVCDIGCDHAFVSIYLVAHGKADRVIASDVRTGPCAIARDNIARWNMSDRIDLRLGDGLSTIHEGEAESVIIAGMGGMLITDILENGKNVVRTTRQLVLQPQSELEDFRRFLYQQGYHITEENMIEEDGKFYPLMLVKKSEQTAPVPDRIACRYGPLLLRNQSQVLLRFLKRQERIYGEILESLQGQGLSDAKRQQRFTEIEQLLKECRIAISVVEK